jgi:hypothetical protein
MIDLNMMEEEFHAHRMEECRHATFFVRQHEMDCEEYKEKREQERAWCEKETYEWGDDEALRKAKWPSLTQDWWTSSFLMYQCVVLNL